MLYGKEGEKSYIVLSAICQLFDNDLIKQHCLNKKIGNRNYYKVHVSSTNGIIKINVQLIYIICMYIFTFSIA